ncbi:MAG: L,D-transpeptidase [Bacteroidia bacterium]|nr:L,D-transpeptidase [Bacteroidia bacterium]
MEDEILKGEVLQPSPDQKVIEDQKPAKTFFIALKVFIVLLALLFLFVFPVYLVPALMEIPKGNKTLVTNFLTLKKDPSYKKQITQLNRDIQRLSRKYSSYTSGQSYIVINTTDNLFYLYRNKKLIREGHCSTGSFKMLKTEEGRSWIFKTPKGKFTIQGKQTNPAWRRPDWAFVEEGMPVPERQDDPSRYEYGVLGDYALALGDGYLIHGTIYKRFLGMPVTHGCVRLNDEDLKAIFNTLSIGSKVYIF